MSRPAPAHLMVAPAAHSDGHRVIEWPRRASAYAAPAAAARHLRGPGCAPASLLCQVQVPPPPRLQRTA